MPKSKFSLKTSKMNDSYESLLKGMSQLWDAWSELDQAKLSISQLKGLLFIAATEKNLPDSAWQCWLDIQNAPEHQANPLGVFEISSYMKAIETAVTNAQKRANAFGTEQRLKSNNRMSTLYGSYNITAQSPSKSPKQQLANINGKCVFCGYKIEEHPLQLQLTCSALKRGGLAPEAIFQIMRKHDINCYFCLTLGHRTPDCPAYKKGYLRKCTLKDNGIECGRMHCFALHKRKPKNFNPKIATTTNVTAAPSQD